MLNDSAGPAVGTNRSKKKRIAHLRHFRHLPSQAAASTPHHIINTSSSSTPHHHQ
jgi:hypothetical protein